MLIMPLISPSLAQSVSWQSFCQYLLAHRSFHSTRYFFLSTSKNEFLFYLTLINLGWKLNQWIFINEVKVILMNCIRGVLNVGFNGIEEFELCQNKMSNRKIS